MTPTTMLGNATAMTVIACLAAALLVGNCVVLGFTPPTCWMKHNNRIMISSSSSTSTVLHYEGGSGFCEGSSQNDNSIEQARKQLEALLATPSTANNSKHKKLSVKQLLKQIIDDNSNSNLDDILPPLPPLTSGERDRRLAELEFLEQLRSSDDALEDLHELWMSEKGKTAKDRLVQIDEFLEAGQVIAAEQMLLKLWQDLDDDNDTTCSVIYWVEPLHRLALVYVQQGRLHDASRLEQCVLHIKPWHVEALDQMVQICLRQGHRDTARRWASQSLPKLVASTSFPPFATNGPANPQRAQWVQHAIIKAQEALSHWEYQTQRDFMGLPEDYYATNQSTNNDNNSHDDTTPPSNSITDIWDISSQQIILKDINDDSSWQ